MEISRLEVRLTLALGNDCGPGPRSIFSCTYIFLGQGK